MTKQEFLNELKNQISEYPSEETKQSLEYYSEMIDDRIEEGMTEAEAIASMGAVGAIAQQIKDAGKDKGKSNAGLGNYFIDSWLPTMGRTGNCNRGNGAFLISCNMEY